MRRPLLSFLAAATLSVVIGPGLADAHRPPVAALARACHNHAGTPEGDGEYTDGAIQNVTGISCAQALALVKPRYHWIYTHWRQAYDHGFAIGRFRCDITPEGPDDLKTCVDAKRRFDFV